MSDPEIQRFHLERALLPEGWARDVALEARDGRIVRVEAGATADARAERLAIALPGLGNLHSHAFQRGMAGLAEHGGGRGDSFWTWRELMYRFLARLDPERMQAIAAMAYVEMLESGFTRVGEFHYLHHDSDGRPYADRAEMAARLAAAAQDTGIGLTLLPVFYAHAGFGGAPPSPAQRRLVHDVDGFSALLEASATALRALPDAVLGLAPHSLRAVTPEELGALLPLAAGPVHIHIAEQVKEVEDCVAWSGQRPVAWLLDHAEIGPRWCLVHATHMDAGECARLAASGAVAGLCPITEANLGDGLFPMRDFVAAGGRFGVGSDSNVLIDAAEELRLLEYGQRLAARARNVLVPDGRGSSGRFLYAGALAGGAQALGASAGLAVGAAADLVELDAAHPALAARDGDALLDSLVFAARGGAVRTVWRRGRRVVADGRHRNRDAVAARFTAAVAGLLRD
ncbi:formimidoylglutamate deiminase [Coralloluteibacterium stylophorae]|uniref:Formimidoylglutamate deiminase n=1 Tax=Coralloluteibacterium stylophorae TaxID=1776034 RepID=A0A8J7VSL0_9GAMM|nr:formimidoylglutamate deiminase [Coralloluteibacterium stylophorae]MBS7455579.1 formimidoylglutamate deiminase [Coralloluteibacterium stylophorae]